MEATMTTDEHKSRTEHNGLLLFSMVSMTMMFAGLTSAFGKQIESGGLVDFELPTPFIIALLL
jgi:cytochrome c oxidase subunit 3